MNHSNKFSCYILGDDNLAIKCASLVLEQGHLLLGIISANKQAKAWADFNKISCYPSIESAKDKLLNEEFDYLFSIIFAKKIPTWLIEKPQKLAINYHNSLLPKYAGVNATSWAILNQENMHGITWHVISEIIDAGDILAQQEFSIDKQETALSLNIKCSHYAVISFEKLIIDLAQQRINKTPQLLNQRSYYSLKQKLPYEGLINFAWPAEKIERFFRAATYHQFTNRFGLPKILIDGNFYIINNMKISTDKSNAKPGVLLEVKSKYLKIATSSHDLMLMELLDFSGNKIKLNLLKKNLEVNINRNNDYYLKLDALSKKIAEFEQFWLKQFAIENNHDFLFYNKSTQRTPTYSVKKLTGKILLLNSSKEKNLDKDLIITGILLLLFCSNNYAGFTIWYSDEALKRKITGYEKLFSAQVILNINFNYESTFAVCVDYIKKLLSKIKENITYSLDLAARYSELKNYQVPGILIDVVNDLDNYHPLFNNSLIIAISQTNGEVNIYYDQKTFDIGQENIINNIINYTNNIVNFSHQEGSNNITQLKILDQNDHDKLIYEWSGQRNIEPITCSVDSLFDEQIDNYLSLPAVSAKEGHLNYSELAQKAAVLAAKLRKNNIKLGSLICVYMENGLELIVSLLAILKAGGGYVPIDLKCPEARLINILNDCKPALILTQEKEANKLQEFLAKANLSIPVEIIQLDSITTAVADTTAVTQPESIAYIIYTSGSTGEPKGVMIKHKSIVRLVNDTNYIKISKYDKVAQAASCSFDAATFEIWGALLNGAHLICYNYTDILDIKYFLKNIQQEPISILWLTSSFFNKCVSYEPHAFANLKYLIIGGEKLNPHSVKTLLNCKPSTPKFLLNGYGPTENTTFTTTYHIKNVDNKFHIIPIGKPIKNTLVYILDKFKNIVPVGFSGELYVAGEGVTAGYINRDELTSNKLLTNPYSRTNYDLMYRTGDIVRWLPDANIDYIGREDQQVKMRGYRIELAEIERVILHYNKVKQCLIDCQTDLNHNKLLIAYIIPFDKQDFSTALLKNYLASRLPEYMLPTLFVVIDAFPLNQSGKIDKKQLLIPEELSYPVNIVYTMPLTPLGNELVNIWKELLKIKQIGLTDNFFELGGHSLQLVEMILRVKNVLGVEIPIFNFLHVPTIANLESLIVSAQADNSIEVQDELLKQDAILAADIQPDYSIAPIVEQPCKTIFITGVTGFLGTHLLYNLYKNTTAKIYCLIKGEVEQGKIRLWQAMRQYGLDSICNDSSERICILSGDLTAPRLGLTGNLWNILEQEVDLIYHNGAYVNHVYDYKSLRAANVLSTLELIKLAFIGKPKVINYISTLSAATLQNSYDYYEESYPQVIAEHEKLINGYSQSKWVSEMLLKQAVERGLSVNVYRLGWILGQSTTGICTPTNNHLLRLIKACVQCKNAPNLKLRLGLLPVDFLSQLIVKISLENLAESKIFNITNPHTLLWENLILWLNKFGYLIDLVDNDIWREKCFFNIDKTNALYPLLALYMSERKYNMLALYDRMESACIDNTLAVMNKLNINFPVIDDNILDKYFRFLNNCGFLRKPLKVSKVVPKAIKKSFYTELNKIVA